MCRFVAYLGKPLGLSALVTEPANSLIHQSFHAQEREEPLNGDGFGVAWYVPGRTQAGIFRSITPAWNNRNLHELARVVESGCIFAHVRAASQGLTVSEENCHPFVHQGYTFMHNGDIGGFRHVRRPLLAGLSDHAFQAIQGSTDSEHLFALFLDRVERRAGPATVEGIADALVAAIGDVLDLVAAHASGSRCYLNLAVTDGRHIVACRYTDAPPEEADSLYVHSGKRYVCEDGVCRMLDPEADDHAVLVSSEPLSTDPGWVAVEVGEVILVTPDRRVVHRPAVPEQTPRP